MGIYVRLAVSASLLMLVGCGAAGSPAGDQTGTVAGLVQARECGGPPPPAGAPGCRVRPLVGAQVELEVAGRVVKSASTDATGHYSVAVAARTYTVHIATAQIPAMSGDTRTVKVEPGQVVEADFDITFQAA